MLKKSAIIVVLILLADQILKIWIKTTFTLGQELPIFGNWFILHFTENPGMAFGMQFGGNAGKLALSILRIVAVALLVWYIWHLNKKKVRFGVIFSFSLILAGAIGNIIDSVFYGVIFSESTYYQAAVMFPPEGGYSSLLHGKVVDMLYFPIIDTVFPDWMPLIGGKPFRFFQPVFNIADSAVTIGIFYLILFERSFFKQSK
ncbi:MAG: lipoprotein signal peptidase [Bacteroidales bacterium]